MVHTEYRIKWAYFVRIFIDLFIHICFGSFCGVLDFIFLASVYIFSRNLKDLCGVAQWIGVISLSWFVPSVQQVLFINLLMACLCIARYYLCFFVNWPLTFDEACCLHICMEFLSSQFLVQLLWCQGVCHFFGLVCFILAKKLFRKFVVVSCLYCETLVVFIR